MTSSLSANPLDVIDPTGSERLTVVWRLRCFNAPTTAIDRAVQPDAIVEVEVNERVAHTQAAYSVLTIIGRPNPAVQVPAVQFWTANRKTLHELLAVQLLVLAEDRWQLAQEAFIRVGLELFFWIKPSVTGIAIPTHEAGVLRAIEGIPFAL